MLKNVTSLLFILFLSISSVQIANAQINQGAIYTGGDTIDAPRAGFKGTIPMGWAGTLPQGSEIFMLIPEKSEGYMFIRAREGGINSIMEGWNYEFALTEKVLIKRNGDIQDRGRAKAASFDVKSDFDNYIAYAEAFEGNHGITYSIALLCPKESLTKFKADLQSIVDGAILSEPRQLEKYHDFVWAERLKNKYLVSYVSTNLTREENNLWFCADGTFHSNLKAGGKLKKDLGDFKGRKTGVWTASGTGATGQINIKVKNLPEVNLEIRIEDNKVFIGDSRFFFLDSDKCK